MGRMGTVGVCFEKGLLGLDNFLRSEARRGPREFGALSLWWGSKDQGAEELRVRRRT